MDAKQPDPDPSGSPADLLRAIRTGRIVPYRLSSPEWHHLASLIDGAEPGTYAAVEYKGRPAVLGLRHGLLFHEE